MGWKNVKSGQATSGPPLDTLRRKRTKGLEVRVEQSEARRGDDVRAVVVVTEPEGRGDLEVGIVCREFYDEIVSDADSAHRSTLDAVEYEAWQPLQCVRGEHAVTLTVAAQAPYSYAGNCLHEGKLESGMSFTFALALPPDALPAVRSRHGQLYWRLDAKSHERGPDSHERRRIEVG